MAAVDFKKLIQEMVVPELRELKVEFKTLHTELKRLDGKIDSLRNEMQTAFRMVDEKFRMVDEKIDSLRHEMQTEFKRVDERFQMVDDRFRMVDEKIDLSLQVRERLVALEAKMAALESRN